jgi:hypothetical protein
MKSTSSSLNRDQLTTKNTNDSMKIAASVLFCFAISIAAQAVHAYDEYGSAIDVRGVPATLERTLEDLRRGWRMQSSGQSQIILTVKDIFTTKALQCSGWRLI